MSRGRILSGFARGVPREYNVYGVSMGESRARFEEAVEIILKAWTEPKFSYEGKYWSYKDIAIWPRPYTAAASAGVGAVHRLEGNHRVGRQAQFQRGDPRPSPRADAGHRRLFRQAARARTATRSRPSTCASSPTPMWRRTARRRSRNTARSISISCTRSGTTARWRRRRRPRAPAICRRRRSTTSSRRTASGAGVDRESMQKTTMADIERKIDDGRARVGLGQGRRRPADRGRRARWAPTTCC